jgi:hypothetical protein
MNELSLFSESQQRKIFWSYLEFMELQNKQTNKKLEEAKLQFKVGTDLKSGDVY